MKFNKLYNLRIDNDLTQQQVADYLMCNRQVYGRYENGIREIPVSMLIKLAEFYNVTLDYLVEHEPKKLRAEILYKNFCSFTLIILLF